MEMLRYHLGSSQATRLSLKKEISSFQYNDKRHAMLVQTTDNFLYLLDADLRIKTRLQITPNDLFQFSRNGNVFYYVLNNRLCIFDNKYDIINLANFESAYSWIQKSLPTGDQMQKILDDYQVTL